MSAIVGLDGKALRAPKAAENDGIRCRKWPWRTFPKCGPQGLCKGLLAMLQDSGNVSAHKGHRLTMVGGMGVAPDGTKTITNPEAVGLVFQTPSAGPQLLMFNFCPACGGKIPLGESRDF